MNPGACRACLQAGDARITRLGAVLRGLNLGLDAKAMVPRAIAARVAYVPGTGFYADGTGRGNMRLNFSFSAPDRLREGVRRLAGVMDQDLAMRAVFGGAGLQAGHQRRRGPAAADAPGPDLA